MTTCPFFSSSSDNRAIVTFAKQCYMTRDRGPHIIETIDEMISNGENVNSIDNLANTALFYLMDNTEVAEHLLNLGAGIDANMIRDSFRNADVGFIKLLISRGYGQLILHTRDVINSACEGICFNGNVKVIKLLVSCGFDVDEKTLNGGTLLHWVCGCNGDDMTLTNDNDDEDNNVEFLFMPFGREEFLLASKDVDISYPFIDCIEELLCCGADVNAKDSRGLTPLMYAVLAGCLYRVKLLIRLGANVDDFYPFFTMNTCMYQELQQRFSPFYSSVPYIPKEQPHQVVESCINHVRSLLLHKQKIAFLCGRHLRIGEESPVQLLNRDVISIVFKHLD